ncbi:MAG: hypothetical protein KAT58_10395 [candidate division Zixibacteria bacterium]|nr:hypothetical protein [candidate division Zixibacteria bacterium]
MIKHIRWPEGRDFAFTIFDDTDLATIENVAAVYDLLKDKEMLTTKSVWLLMGKQVPKVGGFTCENRDYLNWTQRLQEQGFEIGFHNATFHTSQRETTALGLEQFFGYYGHYPATMANHTGCQESIYWGSARLSGLNRLAYNLMTRFLKHKRFRGHVADSKLFWGDICREKIKYVRNFVFSDINTLKNCPYMPYHDPARPYVNYWYASSEGAEVNSFNHCLAERNQDRLEEEGGACIMYTHLACGFVENGRLNHRFRELIERLAKKNGWYVPVATLLDYLLDYNGHHEITSVERRKLERRWLKVKIKIGPS